MPVTKPKVNYLLQAVGPVLVGILLAKVVLPYAFEVKHKHDVAQWKICNIYGPTVEPRPSDEWCKNEKRTRDYIAKESAKNPRPSLDEIFK